MIDEFIPVNAKFNKILKETMARNKDEDPETRLLIKFQIYMIL